MSEGKTTFKVFKTRFSIYPNGKGLYAIANEQIAYQGGLDFWLPHLRCKPWWDLDVERAFVDWVKFKKLE